MATLTPIDHDPFASAPTPGKAKLTPVGDEGPTAAEFTAGMLRKLKQGSALGFGDEASAALKAAFGGRGAEGDGFVDRYYNARNYERKALDKATKDTGWYGTGAEIVGSIPAAVAGGEIISGLKALSPLASVVRSASPAATPLLEGASTALPAVTEAASANLPAAVSKLPMLARNLPGASKIANTGVGAVADASANGALLGGAQGAGDSAELADMPGDTLKGMAVGAVTGPIGAKIGQGINHAASYTNAAARQALAPTTESLKKVAKTFYDKFEKSGGTYTTSFVNDLRHSLLGDLKQNGWTDAIAPEVKGVIKELDRIAQMPARGLGNPTPKQIQNVRSIIQDIRRSADDRTSRYGSILMDTFDNIISNPADHHFTGDGKANGAFLNIGNRFYKQYSKSSEIDDAVWRAENRAASTHSGGNINNATRQNIRGVWEKNNPAMYSPEENKALQVAVRGTTLENLLRKVGSYSPLNGPVSALGVGSILHSYPEAALTVTGLTQGSKFLGNRLQKRNVEEASRVIRNMGKNNPVLPPPNKIQQGVKKAVRHLPGIVGSVSVRGLLDQ